MNGDAAQMGMLPGLRYVLRVHWLRTWAGSCSHVLNIAGVYLLIPFVSALIKKLTASFSVSKTESAFASCFPSLPA